MKAKKIITLVFLLISSLTFIQAEAEVSSGSQYDYAVKSACKWFGDNQNEDGSWNSNEMPFVTSETVKLLEKYAYFGENYERAINWYKANPALSYDFLARYQSSEEISSQEACQSKELY